MISIIIICIISTIIIGVIIAVRSKPTLPPSNQNNYPRVEPPPTIITPNSNEEEEWVKQLERANNPVATNNSSSSSPPSPPPPINIPIPDDLDNILIEISQGEIKDPVTGEQFQPGQKVYLCHLHRLAYHEDSWEDNGYKCIHCQDDNKTKLYTLPTIHWEDIN